MAGLLESNCGSALPATALPERTPAALRSRELPLSGKRKEGVRGFERDPWRQDIPLVVEVRGRTPSLDRPGLRTRAVKKRGGCPGRSSSESPPCTNSEPGQGFASHVSGNHRPLQTQTGVAVNVLLATCRSAGPQARLLAPMPFSLEARAAGRYRSPAPFQMAGWDVGIAGVLADTDSDADKDA